MTLTDLSSDGKAKPNSLERTRPLHTEWSTANRAALLLVPCLSQSSLALSRGWFGWTFLFLLTKWQEILSVDLGADANAFACDFWNDDIWLLIRACE
ncbi:hypothetical protein NC651_002247 [Populus alba x Populus x berolinensis]|nr:hypothetical protein NC651_002247 [Populus alba x Populus x berolinensis]